MSAEVEMIDINKMKKYAKYLQRKEVIKKNIIKLMFQKVVDEKDKLLLLKPTSWIDCREMKIIEIEVATINVCTVTVRKLEDILKWINDVKNYIG